LVSITSCIVNAAVYNLFSPFYLIAAIYQWRCPVSTDSSSLIGAGPCQYTCFTFFLQVVAFPP
ncbi:TPA: hypothetical protein ACQ8HF_005319, partial [Escherichia coli]